MKKLHLLFIIIIFFMFSCTKEHKDLNIGCIKLVTEDVISNSCTPNQIDYWVFIDYPFNNQFDYPVYEGDTLRYELVDSCLTKYIYQFDIGVNIEKLVHFPTDNNVELFSEGFYTIEGAQLSFKGEVLILDLYFLDNFNWLHNRYLALPNYYFTDNCKIVFDFDIENYFLD